MCIRIENGREKKTRATKGYDQTDKGDDKRITIVKMQQSKTCQDRPEGRRKQVMSVARR
jgi:hypothetical protein